MVNLDHMKTKTLTLTKDQLQHLEQQLQGYPLRTDLPHTLFQYKLESGHITAYRSRKVVFSGQQALSLAQQYREPSPESTGSDEVGTGDYFGPMIVCAAYYHPDFNEFLKTFTLTDSKQLRDEQILQEVPLFIDKIPHSLLVLEPAKYNMVQQTTNLNAMKAQMHQKAYAHLKQKLGFLPALNVVDQFTPKDRYYRYLSDDYGITNLTFETKAESKHIAVALAALIARYHFLIAFMQLEKHYQFNFPKGSGALVDVAGQQFVETYGVDELKNVAKLHFKNTQRIIPL